MGVTKMHNKEEDQMKDWKMEVDLVSFCAVCGKYHSALSYKLRGVGVFLFRTIMTKNVLLLVRTSL